MHYPKISFLNRIYRLTWRTLGYTLIKFSPWFAFRWRVLIFRMWGAKVDWKARIYSNVEVWSPMKLEVGAYSTLSNGVKIYNIDNVTIDTKTTLSDGVFICTATKSIDMNNRQLKTGPIHIGSETWLAANVTILPNIRIGDRVAVLYGISVFESIADDCILKPKKNYSIIKRENIYD